MIVQPSLPPGSEKPTELPVLGDKARAVEEVIQRLRSEPASLVSLLVELFNLLGPLPISVLDYVALKLRKPEAVTRTLAIAHRLAEGDASVPRLGLCTNGPCAARGGAEVERILREKGVPFEPLRCQGACDLGPIACYHHGAPLAISAARARSLAKADPSEWEDLLSVEKPVHAFKTEPRATFANIFAKGSHQIATARRHGVYGALESAVAGTPEAVFAAVEEAQLVGAGGEGDRAAEKWRQVREAAGRPKYLVVNGSEREPGSFKDRIILERDPHLVLSGALLAAFAVGASEAWLCLRAEYELAQERIRAAVDEATRAGYLGDRVAGSTFALRLHVRLVPPSYLAGEAGALVDALEGKPPSARWGGPPLAVSGLFGRPTLVHNVETLARLPGVVAQGGAAWRALGCGGSGGLLVACLSGDLKRPGAYEVQRGTPLRELVEGLGGGPAQGKSITAVQVGGSTGAYLPASKLDLPLDDAALAPEGARVGVGAIVAVSEKSCIFDLARRETALFAREATGDCDGCRSLAALHEAMDQLGSDATQVEPVYALVQAVREGARCAFGRQAVAPVESMLSHFPEAARDHAEGRCPCSPKKKAR